MTILDDMWEALEAHQHIADHKGYGEAWARMCSERTAAAAYDAYDAAANAAAAYDAYAYAAYDAAAAYDAYADADAYADRCYKSAIAHITEANDGLAYVRSLLTEGEKV
jgi:hypothetical protein